jgi:hypothetical protein
MATPTKHARTSRGKEATARTTFDKPKTITFAMIELSEDKDVNDRRSAWLGRAYRYRDVTPVFNAWSKIPSLNGSVAVSAEAIRSLEEMKKIDADWYMLSGHHGRLYTEDMILECYSSPIDHANRQDHTGFFNDDYHHGRWEQVTRKRPAAGASDPASWNEATPWDPRSDATYRRPNSALKKFEDVPYTSKMRRKMIEHQDRERYLSCTGKPSPVLAPFATDNPVLEPSMQATRASRCKGVILSACNTLIYRATRLTWQAYFPKAVFIGTGGRIAHGWQLTNAIYKSSMCNKAFWEDPASVLTDKSKVEELARSLAAGFSNYTVAVMYDRTLVLGKRTGGKIETRAYPHDQALTSFF